MAAMSKTMKKEMMVSSLRLEEYMIISDNLFDSRFHVNNVLLSIHGLAKVHDQSRFAVAHALNNVVLMTAERSTFPAMASPMSFPGADDVQDDMEALGWEECGVQSIAHLRSEEEARLVADINSIWSGCDGGAPATAHGLSGSDEEVEVEEEDEKAKAGGSACCNILTLLNS